MNKTLNTADYAMLGATTFMLDALAEDMPHVPFHLHRRWEYGMALQFLEGKDIKTIVDAGGAGSLFAPLATVYGYEVTVVDPSPYVKMAEIQSALLESPIHAVQSDFAGLQKADAVVAISTLEHVQHDVAFAQRMAYAAGKAVFLTVDFSTDGKVYAADQLHTYTKESLGEIAQALRAEGFTVEDGDYDHVGPYIANAYTFASLGGVRAG